MQTQIIIEPETARLCELLAERDQLRAQIAQTDTALNNALRAWSDRKEGSRGGIATEAGARFVLGSAGLLPVASVARAAA